jgi:exonuclease SbcC
MQFLYLIVEDMFSYGGTHTIDLNFDGLTRIVGKNGAGKSSIFNALCQIVFDQNPTEEGKDRVINDVIGKGCWGAVGFLDNAGYFYHVDYARNHKRYGTGIKVYRREDDEWVDKSGAKIDETKEIIKGFLGFNYDNFITSVYLSQNQVNNKFLIGTAGERNKILTDLMNLKFYDDCVALASGNVDTLEDEIRVLEGKKESFEQVYAELGEASPEDLKSLEAELKQVKEQLAELEELYAKVKEQEQQYGILQNNKENAEMNVENAKSFVDEQKIELTAMDKELAEWELSLKENFPEDFNEEDLANAEKEIEQAYDNVTDLTNKASEEKRTSTLYDEQISQVATDTKCYACGQVVVKETLEQHVGEMKKKKEEADKKVQELINEIATTKRNLEELKSAKKDLEDILQEKKATQNKIDHNKETITFQKKRVETAKKAVKDKEDELTICDEQIKNFSMLDFEFDEDGYQNLQELQTEIVGQINTVTYCLEQKDKAKNNVTSVVQEIENKKHDLALFKWWINGFKKLKHYKLERAAVILNESCGRTLSVLHGNMALEFDIESEYKTIKDRKKQKFEIFVRSGRKKKVPVKLYSGGEKILLSCAVTSGLWDVGKECGISNSNLLIIDEPAGSLDDDNREKLSVWLEMLKTKAKAIMFATHVDLPGEIFDRELKVSKENDISTVDENTSFTETIMGLIPNGVENGGR